MRASIDRQALAKVMKLRPDQKVILAQSVGYPKLVAALSGHQLLSAISSL